MFGKLLYRVQNVSSVTQVFDTGHIVSGMMVEEGSLQDDPLDSMMMVPHPDVVKMSSGIVRHLWGDENRPTSFVSLTSDFHRALTIAQYYINTKIAVTENNTELFVIDADRLRTPAIDAFAYQSQVARTRFSGDSLKLLRRVEKLTAVNSEFVVGIGIPPEAIIHWVVFSDLLTRLPSWLLDDAQKLIAVPKFVEQGGIYQAWLSLARSKYKAVVKAGGDTYGPSRALATYLLNSPEGPDGILEMEELADVLMRGPEMPENL